MNAAELTPSGAVRKRRPLLEIVRDLRELIADAEGEVTDTIEALDLELEDKVEAYRVVMLEHEKDTNSFQSLIHEYRRKQEVSQKAFDELKKRLTLAMDGVGVDKIKTRTCTAYFQESKSVEIADEAKFLETAEDRFVKVTQAPRLAEVKKAIDAGELVEGAEVKTNRSLRFR